MQEPDDLLSPKGEAHENFSPDPGLIRARSCTESRLNDPLSIFPEYLCFQQSGWVRSHAIRCFTMFLWFFFFSKEHEFRCLLR